MPDVDGLELLRFVRANAQLDALPVISERPRGPRRSRAAPPAPAPLLRASRPRRRAPRSAPFRLVAGPSSTAGSSEQRPTPAPPAPRHLPPHQ
jgi:hypothetical protein